MKKYSAILLIGVLVALLIFIKLVFFDSKAQQASPPQQNKNQASVVTAYIVQEGKLDNKIFATGTVIANEEIELKPEVTGKIVQLYFQEGSKVSEGDLLVKLNDAELQAQLKKLELQVKLAEERENRQKKLLDVSGVSKEEYDIVLNQLNAFKADVEFTRAQIAKTEIKASFDGVVGLKSVSEGSIVSPTSVIAKIQQVDPVKIDFSVPEKYAGMVKKNDAIRFTLQGSPELFRGAIYAIEPKVDLQTRTVQLRGIASNKEGKIFPGSFAKIELTLEEINDAILIPTEALIPELKGQKVFVSRSGLAQSQKVETGIRTDTHVQITDGLQPGDTVITTGIMQLKPGSKLKITSLVNGSPGKRG